MPTQYQIEKAVGIDERIAQHMMARQTPSAINAMNLLQMQVFGYDKHGFELLKSAVADCRREIEAVKQPPFTCQYCGAPSWHEPKDQTPPPDYCHESDHDYP